MPLTCKKICSVFSEVLHEYSVYETCWIDGICMQIFLLAIKHRNQNINLSPLTISVNNSMTSDGPLSFKNGLFTSVQMFFNSICSQCYH